MNNIFKWKTLEASVQIKYLINTVALIKSDIYLCSKVCRIPWGSSKTSSTQVHVSDLWNQAVHIPQQEDPAGNHMVFSEDFKSKWTILWMKCVGKIMDSTGFFLFQVILLTFLPLVSSHLKTQRCSRNGLREFLDCSVQLSSSICVCTQSGSVQHSSIHILANSKCSYQNI